MQASSDEQEAELFGKQLQVSDKTLEKGKELLKILRSHPEIEANEELTRNLRMKIKKFSSLLFSTWPN
jgi:hypothetical protein